MPADVRTWVARRVKELPGEHDMSLMVFCWGVEREAEQRTYLAEMLGTSSQARAFIDDFVQRKAAASTASGWTSTSKRRNRNR